MRPAPRLRCAAVLTRPRVALLARRPIAHSVRSYPNLFTADLSRNGLRAEFAVPSREKDHWDKPSITVKGPIAQDAQVVPEWMRFLHGEIDLSDAGAVAESAEVRRQLTSAFLDALYMERQLTPAKYEEFWGLYGGTLMEAVARDQISLKENPNLANMLLFRDAEGKPLSFLEWHKKGETPPLMTDTERAAWASAVSAELASLWSMYIDYKRVDRTVKSEDSTQATRGSGGMLTALGQGDAKLMLKKIGALHSGALRSAATELFLEYALWLVVLLLMLAVSAYLVDKDRRETEAKRMKAEFEQSEAKRRLEEEARRFQEQGGYLGAVMRSLLK